MIRGRVFADQNGRPAPTPIGTGLTGVSGTLPLILTLTGTRLTGSIDTATLPPRLRVKREGVLIGTRTALNLHEGANVTITVADDAVNDEIDVTVNASAGGGGAVIFSGPDKIYGRVSPGSGAGEEIDCTAAGRALLDDATIADQRATIDAVGYVTGITSNCIPVATTDNNVVDSSLIYAAVVGSEIVELNSSGNGEVSVNATSSGLADGHAKLVAAAGASGDAGLELSGERDYLLFQSFSGYPSAVARWFLQKTATAGEVGANAGSDLQILRHADNGSILGTAIAIKRDTGAVGVNETSPVAALHLAQDGAGLPPVYLDAYGTSAQIIARTAAGTKASPSATTNGTLMGGMAARGYGATGWSAGGKGLMGIYTAENWTDSAQGTYIRFMTTPIGSTALAERVRITDAGRVTLNGGPQIITGTGSPEGAAAAVVGSLFLRTDGGANTTLYVKEAGTGNTGWVAK